MPLGTPAKLIAAPEDWEKAQTMAAGHRRYGHEGRQMMPKACTLVLMAHGF